MAARLAHESRRLSDLEDGFIHILLQKTRILMTLVIHNHAKDMDPNHGLCRPRDLQSKQTPGSHKRINGQRCVQELTPAPRLQR